MGGCAAETFGAGTNAREMTTTEAKEKRAQRMYLHGPGDGHAIQCFNYIVNII
jgi:hypothetical protein